MDRKPILDLLAEFKAEIINEVEEEIEDEVGKHFRGLWLAEKKTLSELSKPQM